MKRILTLPKSPYLHAAAGVILLVSGLGLWHVRANLSVTNAVPASRAVTPAAAPRAATVSGQPTHLSVPGLGLSLPVIPGYYSPATQGWTLTLHDVQYATITTPPNNVSGNTYLYGHARQDVFGRLHLIKTGASAVLTTGNGHTFTYQLQSVRTTVPTDDSLFRYQGPPILTIQTCSGLFWQYRQLFTFKLVGVQ